MATTRDELRQLIETLSDSELTAAKTALDTLIAEREKALLDAGGILLTPYDPEFEKTMEAFEVVRKRYRNALRELALQKSEP